MAIGRGKPPYLHAQGKESGSMDPGDMGELLELDWAPSIGSSGRFEFGFLGDPEEERAVRNLLISFNPLVWPVFGIFGKKLVPIRLGVNVLIEDLLPGFK